MGDSFYVVHTPSDTIMDLEECKIVRVSDKNEQAQADVDNYDASGLLDSADATYSDDEITLG